MRQSGWGGYSQVMLMEQLAEGRQRGVISSYQSRMMDHVITMHQMPIRLLMRSVKKSLTLPEEATVGDLKKGGGSAIGFRTFFDEPATSGWNYWIARGNRPATVRRGSFAAVGAGCAFY